MIGRKRSAGFTLIEIIMVLALMGVAATLGTVIFSRISDVWKQTTIRTELGVTANMIFDQMRRDFSEVVSPKLSGAVVKGTSQSVRDNRFFKVAIEDDQVVIPVEIVAGPDGRVQRLDVKYHIDRKDGGATLMRTMARPGGAETATVKLADGVLAMAIEYAGTGPSAVRVSVTLMDSVRTYEQISSKAVFPIEVN
jgi:prepilin-type N-terminal cleavage/methylation domain-containing protein